MKDTRTPEQVVFDFVSSVVNSKDACYVGIDPGAHGAIGLLCGNHAAAVDIPTLSVARKRQRKTTDEEFLVSGKMTKAAAGKTTKFDLPGIVAIFRQLRPLRGRLFVALEQAQVRIEGKGSSAAYTAFRIGCSFGMWGLFLAQLGIPTEECHPSSWKKKMGLTSDKERSRAKAMQMFPTAPLSHKRDEGRAESLLLAEYLRRLRSGE